MRSPPPDIPGFQYTAHLGSGGFADVFLYEQEMPLRFVAVKVMLSDLVSESARMSFDIEANLMARVSNHPSIVAIYQVGIAGDGRPFLVMEYCPRPNLGVRYKRERFSVAEALRIGIQVSGAVESAHRAGILHRDIKPSNILVTEYNRPALTDFGISVTTGGAQRTESEGMSVPWSPPELVAESSPGDVTADVYSLAATVYTLLAGRSPFEQVAGDNSVWAIAKRIEAGTLPPLGRTDVPASLDRLLATAMSKTPQSRLRSAMELGRAFQRVQMEMQLPVTPVDVLESGTVESEPHTDGEPQTRVRSVVVIDPDRDPIVVEDDDFGGAASRLGQAHAARSQVKRTETSSRKAPQVRDPEQASDGDEVAAPGTSRIIWIIASGLAIIAIVVGVVFAFVNNPGATDPGGIESYTGVPSNPVGVTVWPPGVESTLYDEKAGTWTFVVSNPRPEQGDVIEWRDPFAVDPAFQETETGRVVVVARGGEACIEARIRRNTGRLSATERSCASEADQGSSDESAGTADGQ